MPIQFLEQDKIAHIDMIESVKRGTGHVLAANINGVLIFDMASQLYLISAKKPEAAKAFINMMGEAKLVAAHQNFVADMLTQKLGLHQIMCCHQAIWEYPQAPNVIHSSLKYRTLGLDMTEEVLSTYSHDIGIDYIRNRLLAGEMLGAFSDDELAGFIGLHKEGSMGMLEVKPSFRRKGIASQLISRLCTLQLSVGQVPFSQFTLENEQSRKLHEHLGFSISTECVYWLEK